MTRDVLPTLLFFFNDTATTEIYTLSLHDALPISERKRQHLRRHGLYRRRIDHAICIHDAGLRRDGLDRKSTRLNSSHLGISYAVFCLKKKKKTSYLRYFRAFPCINCKTGFQTMCA